MFERFTDKARTAVILARTEASERGDQIRRAGPRSPRCFLDTYLMDRFI
jgi:hypothetical protein